MRVATTPATTIASAPAIRSSREPDPMSGSMPKSCSIQSITNLRYVAGIQPIVPRLQARHRYAVERCAVAFARDAIAIGVEPVGIPWIGAEHRLSLRLTREVGAVVAMALTDVRQRVET